MPSIADLLALRRLERVPADPRQAAALLDHANAHVSSAEAIVELDPVGAYQLAYDAARKAIAADMAATGFRAKADRPGAHAATIQYAEEALAGKRTPRRSHGWTPCAGCGTRPSTEAQS